MNKEKKIAEESLDLADRTGVFNAQELAVLKEVLDNWAGAPGKDYSLIEENIDGKTAGFLIFGQTPMTENSWDLYWMAVSPDFYRRGLGSRLINRFEEKICDTGKDAVIRIETSSIQEYSSARSLYLRCSYIETGRIDNFYWPGNSLITYSKQLKCIKKAAFSA